jgi:hypothetical protein
VCEHPQAPLAALRARVSGEGHRVVMRLVVLGSIFGGIDGRSDLAEPLATAAIGEQAEMADAPKALREDVEQKPANELFPAEGHHLMAVPIAVVLIVERHLIVIDTTDAHVTPGDAVAIAAQVVHHRLGVGETGFGVDDPVGGPKGIEQGIDRADLAEAIEPTVLNRLAQAADEAATDMP